MQAWEVQMGKTDKKCLARLIQQPSFNFKQKVAVELNV